MEAIYVKASVSPDSSERIREILRSIDSNLEIPENLKMMARIACLKLDLPPVTTNMRASDFAERRKAETLKRDLETHVVPKTLGTTALTEPEARVTGTGLVVIDSLPGEGLNQTRKDIAESYIRTTGRKMNEEELGVIQTVIPGVVVQALAMHLQNYTELRPLSGHHLLADMLNEGLQDMKDADEELTIEGNTTVERVTTKEKPSIRT